MSAETATRAEPVAEPERILVPSPIGNLGLELGPRGVIRLLIAPKGGLRRKFQSLDKVEWTDRVDEVVGRLSEYFAGARRQLEIDYDLKGAGVSGFPRRVLRQTARIPYARTRTYQQIAEAAGRPEAYRQVLSVLLANPLPILVPCHRVVTSKSGVGSYIGGAKRKARLLQLEAETGR